MAIKRNNEEKESPIKSVKLEAGKMFIDVAKLVFGGIILASIMRSDISPSILYALGSLFVISFIIIGLYLVYYSKKK